MTIDETISTGWAKHDTDPEGVLERAIGAIEEATGAHAVRLAGLVSHIAGEHLADPERGVVALEALAVRAGELAGPVHRTLASLLWHQDRARAEELLAAAIDPGHPPASSRIRTLCAAASMAAATGRTDDAAADLEEALALAGEGLDRQDPAAKSLAISGNNIACGLEELTARTPEQTSLMKRAAKTGRVWWEVAGDWNNVKIAEVRLCMTHLKAGEPEVARAHATTAIEICDDNDADQGSRFFPWLVRAEAELALGARDDARDSMAVACAALESTPAGMRGWCLQELDRVQALAR